MLASMRDRGTRIYLLVASLLVLSCLVTAALLFRGKDFPDHGPLSPSESWPRHDPALEHVLVSCNTVSVYDGTLSRIVTATVDGRRLYACYRAAVPTPGGHSDVVVIDESGLQVSDPSVLKTAGAWPWRGVIVQGMHLVYGVVGLAAICLLGLLLYRAPLPGPPLQSGSARGTRRPRSWRRRARIAGRVTSTGFGIIAVGMLFEAVRVQDPWGMTTMAFLVAGFFLATVGAWFWLMHPDFDRPDRPIVIDLGQRSRSGPRTVYPATGSRPATAPFPSDSHQAVEVLRIFRAKAKTRAVASSILRGAVTFQTITIYLVLLLISPLLLLASRDARLTPLTLFFGVAFSLVLWAVVLQLLGIAAALLALPLILGWRDPARILLLRPFNRADHSRPLRALARREAAGYGHLYSLADSAIKVRWYVAVPVLLGQLGLMSFRLARLRHAADVAALGRRVKHVRRRNLNWVVAYSKVFAVRCVDEVWQQSVMELLSHSDAVLMDVTDVTDNMRWEIDALVAGGHVDDCLFLALRGREHEATATISLLLRRPVEVFAFDNAGRLAEPRAFRDQLASAIFRNARGHDVGGQVSAINE